MIAEIAVPAAFSKKATCTYSINYSNTEELIKNTLNLISLLITDFHELDICDELANVLPKAEIKIFVDLDNFDFESMDLSPEFVEDCCLDCDLYGEADCKFEECPEKCSKIQQAIINGLEHKNIFRVYNRYKDEGGIANLSYDEMEIAAQELWEAVKTDLGVSEGGDT